MYSFFLQGDLVDEFQPLCEVQSDKATIEITSRYKGRVAQTLFIPGDIVKVKLSSGKLQMNPVYSMKRFTFFF